MFLLLDLDNTLLPSKGAYDYAVAELAKDWSRENLGKENEFLSEYEVSRQIVKQQLGHHSSNRLRLLCFKHLLERKNFGINGKEIDLLFWLEERYFYHFGNSLRNERDSNPEWQKLFSILQPIFENRMALILSNETLRTQLIKVKAFYPKEMRLPFLTSEEVGVEKPNPLYFQYALNKVNKKPQECIMIGDNLIDDIGGANASGISAIHLKSMFGNDPTVHQSRSESETVMNFEAYQIISAIKFALQFNL